MFGLDHEQLTRLAEAEPPGCCGLTYLPYLMGERTPCWPHASGALLGLRPGGEGRSTSVRVCWRPGLVLVLAAAPVLIAVRRTATPQASCAPACCTAPPWRAPRWRY